MTLPLRYLLAALSGCVAVLAFPPTDWFLVVLIAYPLLFLAIRGADFRHGMRLGVVHGLFLYGIGLSWFYHIFGAPAVALWLVLAIFTGLACAFLGWASKAHPRAWWLPLYAALVWVAVEYFRSEWFTLRFPWFTPGVAWGPNGILPWIGVYGTSFFLMYVAASWVFRERSGRYLASLPLLLLLMVVRPSSESLPSPKEGAIPVLAVQSENCDFHTYLEASSPEELHEGIIVWPEYSTPIYVQEATPEWEKLLNLAAQKSSVIVFGTTKALPGNKHYNIARTVDQRGELGWHAKNRPVHLMNDGEPGLTTEPVITPMGKLGTPICFDNDYSEIPRKITAAGAEVFVVPSMDARHWTERQHLQHAKLVQLRAAENGRWFVVASTSGVSQIVDDQGRVVRSLPIMEDGILRGEVIRKQSLTFFTRVGWVFPWIVCGAALAWTGVLIARMPRTHRHSAASSTDV